MGACALNEERGEKSRKMCNGTALDRTSRLRAFSNDSGSFGEMVIRDQRSGVHRHISRHCLQTSIRVLSRTGASCGDEWWEGSVEATKMTDSSSLERSRMGEVSATASDSRAVKTMRWSRSVERVDSRLSNWARRKGTSTEDGGRDWARDNAAWVYGDRATRGEQRGEGMAQRGHKNSEERLFCLYAPSSDSKRNETLCSAPRELPGAEMIDTQGGGTSKPLDSAA